MVSVYAMISDADINVGNRIIISQGNFKIWQNDLKLNTYDLNFGMIFATCDIFRYHGHHFLKSLLLIGNFKLFSSPSVDSLWDNIYVVLIDSVAECNFIKMLEVTPQQSPTNSTYFHQSDLQYAKKLPKIFQKKWPKIIWPKIGLPTGRLACVVYQRYILWSQFALYCPLLLVGEPNLKKCVIKGVNWSIKGETTNLKVSSWALNFQDPKPKNDPGSSTILDLLLIQYTVLL